MKLLPPDGGLLALAATWLGDPANHRWLDFGQGRQALPAAALALLVHRPTNVVRVFTSDVDATPIGLVALSDVSTAFRTANLWYVLGDKTYGGRGLTSRAVARLLTTAFREHGLAAIDAWAVDVNRASIAVLEHNRFTLIGRQRRCHLIEGQPHDRLLYDLLAEEHEEIPMRDDVIRRLQRLFDTRLHVPAPAPDTDLLDGGVIDSLAFVTLLSEVEREFEIRIPLMELDFDRVRSLAAIADLVTEGSRPTHVEPARHEITRG